MLRQSILHIKMMLSRNQPILPGELIGPLHFLLRGVIRRPDPHRKWALAEAYDQPLMVGNENLGAPPHDAVQDEEGVFVGLEKLRIVITIRHISTSTHWQ